MLYIIISIGFITSIEKSYTYSHFRYAIVSDLRGRGKEKTIEKTKRILRTTWHIELKSGDAFHVSSNGNDTRITKGPQSERETV